jgi:hypothetical protein
MNEILRKNDDPDFCQFCKQYFICLCTPSEQEKHTNMESRSTTRAGNGNSSVVLIFVLIHEIQNIFLDVGIPYGCPNPCYDQICGMFKTSTITSGVGASQASADRSNSQPPKKSWILSANKDDEVWRSVGRLRPRIGPYEQEDDHQQQPEPFQDAPRCRNTEVLR